MNKKILVCGDSFCIEDPRYPGLHFTDKIKNKYRADIINQSGGGASNSMIAVQFLHSMNFEFHSVIFSFTGNFRYEYDNDLNTSMDLLDSLSSVKQYMDNRYISSCVESNQTVKQKNKDTFSWRADVISDQFENIKQWMPVMLCISMCEQYQIPYCYSLGGIEYQQHFLSELKLNKPLADTRAHTISCNLWDHYDTSKWTTDSWLKEPYFHVADDVIQQTFADNCAKILELEEK